MNKVNDYYNLIRAYFHNNEQDVYINELYRLFPGFFEGEDIGSLNIPDKIDQGAIL